MNNFDRVDTVDSEKSWTKFIQTGKVNDYLAYVNSCRENELIEGNYNKLQNRRFGGKRNDSRGE